MPLIVTPSFPVQCVKSLGTEPPRVMNLREEHFLGRPFQSTPFAATPLQRPQLLTIRESTRKTPLQISEERLDLQTRIESELGPGASGTLSVANVIGASQPISVHADFDPVARGRQAADTCVALPSGPCRLWCSSQFLCRLFGDRSDGACASVHR